MTTKLDRIFLNLITLLLFAIFVLCVHDARSQSVVIQGNIKNTAGELVEFATVQVFFDSVHHQVALSDIFGNYRLEVTKKGNCELLTNMLGYLAAQEKFILTGDTTINFVLQPNPIMLHEVTIIGQKDLIQVKSDRLVINIGGNIETKGKETTDILKQLPTVQFSEGQLNIFGKSSALVYINDRIVRLEGGYLMSYLNSLPPDIIESVEIISTPPAQYDAEKNMGIIRIITKKNILPGWKGYLKAGYFKNSYSSYAGSVYANYSGEKMFFEGNIIHANDSHLNQSNYYCYFPNETTTTINPKKWNYLGSVVKTLVGYNFNKNSNIILDLQIPLYNKETVTDIKNQADFINKAGNQLDSTIYSNGKTLKNIYAYNAELFFKHLFSNKKSYFTASMAYLNNYTQNNRHFSSLTQINHINFTTDNFYTRGSLSYNILTPKLDFSFPLFSCIVHAGLKGAFIKTSSNNEFYNVIRETYILDSALFNKFDYSENIQSVYYSMEKTIQKWSFQAGIRAEITQTVGKSLIINEWHKNHYTDFFPTINISHQLNNSGMISLSYADRIERPPYQYLDPFKWYISQYDYAQGNPFLKPSYIKNVELSYLFKNTWNAKIYYNRQNNQIGQYVLLDSLNILNQIQKANNFFNVNTYGVALYKFLKVHGWLETVLQGNFDYSEYQSNNKEFSDRSGISSTAIMNNTFFINKNFQIVLNIEEKPPGLYDYRHKNNFLKVDTGASFIHNKSGFEVRLFVNDIFKTAHPEYFYVSDGIKQIFRNYHDSRALELIITWKLGNWHNKTSQISSPSNLEEKQRL